MLFEQAGHAASTPPARPALPKDFVLDYDIGFLFNFASGKSTRFDLEPVLIYKVNGVTEYKRISMQVEKGLAFLHLLDDAFYQDLLEFSDRQLLQWMTQTGNRFIRNHAGSWAHVSVKELISLRKHYTDLLHKLWPALVTWPHLYYLKAGRFSNTRQQEIKLGSRPASFRFRVELKDQLLTLHMIVLLDGAEAPLEVWGGFLLENAGVLYLLPDHESLAWVDLFKNGPLTFPATVKKEIVAKYVVPWMRKYEVTLDARTNITMCTAPLQSRVRLSELNESNLMICPEFQYDDVTLDYSETTHHVFEAGGKVNILLRNREEELKLYEFLRGLHPAFARQRNNHYYHLPFEDVMKRGWFISMLRQLQDAGYGILGFESLKKFRYSTHEPEFIISAEDAPGHFLLTVTIRWGEQAVAVKEVRQAILNGQDTLMLEDGTLGHIPDSWTSQYSPLLRTGSEENGKLKISKMHFTLLEDLMDKFEGQQVQKEIVARRQKMLHYDTLEKTPLSAEIRATLRPYQLSGFHWLQALDELGWGGCLADDMGLGKTLQTISFLQFLKEKYKGSTQLVICPTSLIFNWESELQKFCPSLKFHTHYGMKREFTENHFEDFDVVLTTYGVVRNDLETLSGFLWQYVILDESQAIKNPDAQVTRAVLQLRGVNRVILSGTPVQNNTSDLYGQFNFLNPGLLGSREFFNREFVQPIDKGGSQERTRQLKKMIYPFTLRRTKEQVAPDLPDKTVSVLWCTMEPAQRNLYNKYRDGYRTRLLKKIDEEGIARSGMDVLEGLLRLRQICDHPVLVTKSEDDNHTSVKINELIREVQENAGHHKVLIFSQFTEMLQCIRKSFDEAGVTCCYLDGSTSLAKRKEQVETFQQDESIKTFLISLKAGGVGLNLTVADYVYVVDPWWNPAAEQQAIDRAHRIGQTRKVFAYKMICKDTVEEKILRLQEKKKMLADDLIQEDAGFVKNLSRDDVAFLFG